ncbi:MAG: PD-(D/E)XK nuclease family protein [Janthinobacterium lividum]
MILSSASVLLGQVSSLRRTQEKLALLSGENFNIFRILGLETREVRTHSAFLGELLNPAGSHGLRDTFLKLFLRLINFPNFDASRARLVVEHHIGQINAEYSQGGRIDIYLEAAGQYIFIENKIYASDQQNQLGRYQAHRPSARLLYLTLDGSEPTDWGAGTLAPEHYQCLSYHTDIMGWLEQCRQAAAAYPLVRETIVQYQHLLNHLTGRASTDFIRMEMQQLVRQSEESFVSAFALKQAFEESQAALVEELAVAFRQAWKVRFSENLSPLPAYVIHFQLFNNSYGFRAIRNGEEVAATQEEALHPLIARALTIPKLRRDTNWMAWKWMEKSYFDNLQPAELYQAATSEAVRQQLFEERLQEAASYFDKFKVQMAKLVPGS